MHAREVLRPAVVAAVLLAVLRNASGRDVDLTNRHRLDSSSCRRDRIRSSYCHCRGCGTAASDRRYRPDACSSRWSRAGRGSRRGRSPLRPRCRWCLRPMRRPRPSCPQRLLRSATSVKLPGHRSETAGSAELRVPPVQADEKILVHVVVEIASDDARATHRRVESRTGHRHQPVQGVADQQRFVAEIRRCSAPA